MTHGYSLRVPAGGLAIVLAASILPSAAHAAAAPKPGLWKVVSNTEGGSKPERSKTACLSAVDLDFAKHAASQKGGCERTDVRQDAAGISWRTHCPGTLSSETTTTYVFDTDAHYTGTVSVAIARIQKTITVKFDARRVGECKK